MTKTEVVGSSNLMIGCCVLAEKNCCVLFDSLATHSFVPKSCVQELGLLVCELQFGLVVSTPTSGLVRISSLCARCLVEVEGHMFKVILICLPLQGLDVTLEMDWLSTNRILIDCQEKRLLFSNSKELDLFFLWCFEGDLGWCVMLHDLCIVGG